MDIASVTLPLLGGATGLWAAYCWLKASQIEISPESEDEPPERQDATDGWVGGTMEAFKESARLNAKAALWTGISVFLQTCAAVMGVWHVTRK